MADEIKSGSVVQLKSGGPRMTVRSLGNYNGAPGAFCEWFTTEEAPWKTDSSSYLLSSLKLVEV